MRFTSIALALAAAVVDAAKKKEPPTMNQPLDDAVLYPVVCEDDQSTLVITVVTDTYPAETSWKLKKRNGFRDWQIIAEEDYFPLAFTEYSDTFCIDSGDTYRWNIRDSRGDGLCSQGNCGSYTITLDGHDIAVGARFGDEMNVIATGGDCVDGVGEFRFIQSIENGKIATFSCSDVADYLEISPGLAITGCRIEGRVGGELLDYCPGTCGAYGYGRRGRCCDPCVETEIPTSYPTSYPTTTFPPTTYLPTTYLPTPTTDSY